MNDDSPIRDEVREILECIGAEQYLERFKEARIGSDVLGDLTENDLRELDIPLGDRKRILNRIAEARAPKRPEPERRIISVLFVDLVGSTQLSEQLDLEDYHDVISTYQTTTAAILKAHGGFLARKFGDGMLCYFGYPKATETDAENAANAATQIVADVAELSLPDGTPLQVRQGIATGLTLVDEDERLAGHESGQIFGEAPNLAARLQALAATGEVVICDRTRNLIGGQFRCETLGPQTLKGFEEPEIAWKLIRPISPQTRFEGRAWKGLTPFVNRTAEFRLMADSWQKACAGQGQFVLATGEPGIGKSRLVREFVSKSVEAGSTRIQVQCDPDRQGRPFHPVSAYLERTADRLELPDTADRVAAIAANIQDEWRFQADPEPILRALMSHSSVVEDQRPAAAEAKALREATFDFMLGWIDQMQARSPTLIIVEDLHWIDPSTRDLLEAIIQMLPKWRVMILSTSRTKGAAGYEGAAINHIPIEPLHERETREIIDLLLENRQLAPDLSRHILGRIDGVPLFLEELTKAILENPALERQNGAYALPSTPNLQDALPTTLLGSMLARLDHRPGAREVAPVGAAIGREFSLDLLQSVVETNAERLNVILADLVEARILIALEDQQVPRFRFAHALMQEAAYKTLLKNRRREIHKRIAITARDHLTASSEARPDRMAFHFSRAGDFTEARRYWLHAARDAQDRSANFEAVSYCQKALEASAELPLDASRTASEIAIRETLYVSQEATMWGSSEIATNLQHIRALRKNSGDQSESLTVMHGLAGYHLIAGELGEAVELSQEMIGMNRAQHPSAGILGHRILGISQLFQGKYTKAIGHFEASIIEQSGANERDLKRYYHANNDLVSRVFIRWAEVLSGRGTKALPAIRDCVARAEAEADTMSQLYAFNLLACIHQSLGDLEAVLDFSGRAIVLADEVRSEYWLAWARIMHGWASAHLENRFSTVAEIESGIEDYFETGARQFLPYARALLAESYLAQGDHDEADKILSELQSKRAEHEMRYVDAMLDRLSPKIEAAKARA